ncbi:hypothetical protein [Methanocaldococcus infernus]|uniref:Uncharacterized protein n=1 Tax=Methanocaldococcus infernus (strain DSM 11812 / JCM 15783 / ME) TaxID=573063 RepID=D5VUC9_METIM|nr:hypothetical protein [Methanocaldococcus infernus]ADG12741.1 conserved hypothetical protein [Methanocaldococcus infernus ME]
MKLYDLDDEKFILPPGIPSSVIARVTQLFNVRYESEPPSLIGKREEIEKAKEFIKKLLEAKMFLKDIGKLAKRHKVKAKIYCEDDELRNLLKIAVQDIVFREYLEILDEKIEGEKIKFLDKEVIISV